MKRMLLLLLLCSLSLKAADLLSQPAFLARLKKKQEAAAPPSWTPSNLTALVSWWNPDYAVTNASGKVTNFFDIIGNKHLTNYTSVNQPTMVGKNGRNILGFADQTLLLRCASFAEPISHMSFIFIANVTNRYTIQYFLGTFPNANSRKSGVNLQCGTSTTLASYNQTNKLCIISHVKYLSGQWRESLMTNLVVGSQASSSAGFSNVYFMNTSAANIGLVGLVGDCFFLRTNANAASMAGDMSNLYVWATNKYGVF